MFRLIIAAILIQVSFASAKAAGPIKDVAYFAAHPAERHAVLSKCRSDVRYADSYDCENALRGDLNFHRKDRP